MVVEDRSAGSPGARKRSRSAPAGSSPVWINVVVSTDDEREVERIARRCEAGGLESVSHAGIVICGRIQPAGIDGISAIDGVAFVEQAGPDSEIQG